MIRMIQAIRYHAMMTTDIINHKPQRAILSASWGFLLPSCTIPKPIPASCTWGFLTLSQHSLTDLCCCAASTIALPIWFLILDNIVTHTTLHPCQKPEHSTTLQPIMFGFFYAYSLHIPCIIGIDYMICYGYRHRLLK